MHDKPSLTDILSPGQRVRIEAVNRFGNKIITNATVVRMDERQLALNLQGSEGIFNQVNANVDVKLFCKNVQGNTWAERPEDWDYVFGSNYIKVNEAKPPQLIVALPVLLTGNGLRHSVENCINVPFSYFLGEKEIKGGVVKKLTPLGLKTFIAQNKSLEIGLGLPFKLSLPTSSNPLLMMGAITDLNSGPEGCQMTLDFSHSPLELQGQITKYLFSLPSNGIPKEHPSPSSFIKIN